MLSQLFTTRHGFQRPVIIGLGVALIAFCLLGGLLSPAENTHNLPVALVNADQGAAAGGQPVNFGREITARLTAPQPADTLKWTVLDSRDTAWQELSRQNYYAVLVIPPDYTAKLLALVAQTGTAPAQLEILTNPTGPAMGAQMAQGALQNITAQLSKNTGTQLQAQVQAAKITPALPAAGFLADPVQAKVTPVAAIGSHSGNGISIFFLALLLSLVGVVSALLPNLLLEHLAATRRQDGRAVSAWDSWASSILLSARCGFLGVVGLLGMAWLLNMDVPDWLSLGLFCTLFVWTISWLTLLFQAALGRAGVGLAALLLIIMSLPASGGLFPVESVPALWQWLYAVTPMRFMVAGVRSVLFFHSDFATGLGTALAVLASYAGAALALSALLVGLRLALSSRKPGQDKRQPLQPVMS